MRKSIKKISCVILSVIMSTFIFASCKSSDKITIGICQLVKHEALDAATEGFKKAIIDKLGKDNVEFLEQDAAGESNTCVTIVNDFVSKDVDLIMANGTAALQAAANATQDIPILGTSITEYGVALEIKNFTGTVGGNISGTSDLAPLTEQAQMILDIVPKAKTVALLYCSAEPNSKYQVEKVKEYLEQKGVATKDCKFSASSDVAQIAEVAATCDAIYIPTDNTAASCTKTINGVVLPKKVPIIAGEEGICKGCGAVTLSISYDNIGVKTGEMAVDILKNGKDISKIAIAYDEKPVKKYNKEICQELGITPPEGFEPISE